MYELHQAYEFERGWLAEYGPGFEGNIVIVADGQPDQGAESKIDTSFVVAAEDRTSESQALELATSGGDKKPPFDLPPDGHTTFEDPEEGDNERESVGPAETLGVVAIGSEIRTAGEQSQVAEHLEVTTDEYGTTTIINRAHSQPDLPDKFIARLDSEEPWTQLEIYTSHERTFLVDDPKDPSFFVKVTDPSDNPEGQKELEVAPLVQSIVASEQAQHIAQKHGFSSVTYVEPLAVIDKPGEHEIVAYPYQDGGRITGSRDGRSGLLELQEVATEMSGLFGANDVDAFDIDTIQFIAEGDELYLLDAEQYRQFEPLQPALEAGEMERSIYGGWESASGPAVVEPGKTVIARQAEDGTGVEISAVTQDTYVVALWNTSTNEAALLNIRENREAYRQVEHVAEHAPSLMGRNVIVHIFGPTNPVFRDPNRYPLSATVEMAVSLTGRVAQTSSVDVRGQAKVSLDTENGRLKVTTESGETKYFDPPKRIS